MAAQVALRRQQNAQATNSLSSSSSSQVNAMAQIEKVQNLESLLAQKRAYQKQLKSLQQQSVFNRQVHKGN